MALTVAARHNIEIDQGADWGPLPVAYQQDGATNSAVTAPAAEVRTAAGVLLATMAATVDGTTHVISLSLDDAVTATIPAGRHQWDVFATITATGERLRILAGTFDVRERVTGRG